MDRYFRFRRVGTTGVKLNPRNRKRKIVDDNLTPRNRKRKTVGANLNPRNRKRGIAGDKMQEARRISPSLRAIQFARRKSHFLFNFATYRSGSSLKSLTQSSQQKPIF